MRENEISIQNFSSETPRDVVIYVKIIKGKVHQRTGHEISERESRNIALLFL
jgi:hypothetical protein